MQRRTKEGLDEGLRIRYSACEPRKPLFLVCISGVSVIILSCTVTSVVSLFLGESVSKSVYIG